MLGARPTTVYHPPDNAGYGADGYWSEAQRTASTQNLTIEPMARGDYLRSIGPDGEWSGGAILIFSETDRLQVANDQSQSPGSWVEFEGLLYQVDSRSSWYDDELGHCEYTAFLIRPQPTFEAPEEPE